VVTCCLKVSTGCDGTGGVYRTCGRNESKAKGKRGGIVGPGHTGIARKSYRSDKQQEPLGSSTPRPTDEAGGPGSGIGGLGNRGRGELQRLSPLLLLLECVEVAKEGNKRLASFGSTQYGW
jgi:hypothetical protein